MRVNITVDIDGTDEQQEQALDILEDYAESNTWPWMVGLYLTKREARRAAARLRAQWRRSVFPPTTYSVFVRPVWHAP